VRVRKSLFALPRSADPAQPATARRQEAGFLVGRALLWQSPKGSHCYAHPGLSAVLIAVVHTAPHLGPGPHRSTLADVLVTAISYGLLAGIAFGAISVGMMMPLQFPDKRAALLGAFLNRFAIGLLIPLVHLGVAGWILGLGLGILLSLPDAIITKAVAPILGVGAVGGTIIGWLANHVVVG